MKPLSRSSSSFFLAVFLVAAVSSFFIACPTPSAPCTSNTDCKTAGETCDTTTKTCISSKEKTGDVAKSEPTAETTTEKAEDKVTPEVVTEDGGTTEGNKEPLNPDPTSVCPPGCPTCSGVPDQGPTEQAGALGLGGVCKADEQAPVQACQAGLICVANGLDGKGFCYKGCNQDSDCTNGEKCLEQGSAQAPLPKVCGVSQKPGQTCNYARQEFCSRTETSSTGAALQIICLIDNVDDNSGICYQICNLQNPCPKDGDLVCRPFSTSSTTTLCMDRIDPGTKCMYESCDGSATATNCLSSLICNESVCQKPCSPATQETDCDVAVKKETCFKPFGATQGFCRPPPSVTKAGEECSGVKRCDDTLKLQCVGLTETRSECVKTCDEAKGATGNPDCQAGEQCQKPQGISFAFCRKTSPVNGSCVGAVCSEAKNICVGFSADGTEAYCLLECDTSKNKSPDDESNPDCENGKGTCISLSGGGTRGACLPFREKVLDEGKACGTDNGGLKAPDCKEGLRCVGLGGVPLCYVDCDPCKATRKGADWVHSACNAGAGQCIPLQYSDGRPAGGICESKAGNPVLEEGAFCGDDPEKTCKKGVVCVRFSSEENAKSVCSAECDPGKPSGNPACGGGRCGRLTSGGGVCIPTSKATRKYNEECLNGEIGTVGFDDCLDTDNGKPLVCARAAIPGLPRACQYRCELLPGIKDGKDNPDCKALGLNNHLCVVADVNRPTRGACLEICTVTNRLRCETSPCAFGKCSETRLGRVGDCDTTAKEDACKASGGLCIDKTCAVNVCN